MESKSPVKDLQIRGLKVDPVAYRVHIDDRELNLTPREFDVLLYLSSHAGSLVSRDELLSAVWGTADVVGDDALRTVIKRLRCKLGDDSKSPCYIVNIWSRGYRLEQQSSP
ncbi:MAG: winged helix-turn-helix transcriptional regulator [Anaerolineae bacterium]|nr:winged helix-turn-helix transcriptional regulator [Anaerolineae bacterium]